MAQLDKMSHWKHFVTCNYLPPPPPPTDQFTTLGGVISSLILKKTITCISKTYFKMKALCIPSLDSNVYHLTPEKDY